MKIKYYSEPSEQDKLFLFMAMTLKRSLQEGLSFIG